LFLIDRENVPELAAYLGARGILAPGEPVTQVAKAGEGNMNCTLRVATPRRTIIVKQGRPWVEKYPHITAPADRTRVEAAFYGVAARCARVGGAMPQLLDADADARVLVLEDAGDGGDFTGLYGGATLGEGDCAALLDYLLALHACELKPGEREVFVNRDMRALNYEHIFLLPLREDNGLALDAITPGLQAAADALKRDQPYVERVTALGDRYLADGDVLVHGDFFPGSWLHPPADVVSASTRTSSVDGVIVIDPEFCFLGCAEFDFGVMLAHLTLAGQPGARLDQVERGVARGRDLSLMHQFAGVEIMRRLIGVAQLPLAASLAAKQRLLDRSRTLVLA
jgi:5-methylthioribose kinase